MSTRRAQLAQAEQEQIAARFMARARAAKVAPPEENDYEAETDQGDEPDYDGMYQQSLADSGLYEEEQEETTMANDPRDFRAPSDREPFDNEVDDDMPLPGGVPRRLPTAAQAPVSNPAPQPPPVSKPGYYEIDVEGETVEIGLRTRRGVVAISVPPMTMKRINMLGWHQEKVNRLQQQLLNTGKADAAERVADQARRAQEGLIRYMIPDFPVGVFGDMSAIGFKRLMDIINQMTDEALDLDSEGGDDPNA